MDAPARVPATIEEAIEYLRTTLRGDLLTPRDAGYDDARRTPDPDQAQLPTLIVVAAAIDDVVQAVRFARARQLPVAVQATGHGLARPADGALLIRTSRLNTVTVDPACATASVSAGATWGDVLRSARAHRLAPAMGESSEVGAVGDTLGGGMGWLARRHGLAGDAVVAFELVTPDGLVVTVSPDEQPELFWALKGGGNGSLGVVTSMEIELHPVTTVYAGALVYPVELARDVLDFWRRWVTGVRPELTSSVVLTTSSAAVHGCWSGAVDTGRELVDAWRAWRPPALDRWFERPFADVDAFGDDTLRRRPPRMTSEWACSLRDELLDAVAVAAGCGDGSNRGEPAAGVVEVRHAGGSVRARSEAAADGRGRRDPFLLTFAGVHPEAVAPLRERLAPFVTGATFLDHVSGEERETRTRSAFGDEQFARLRAVKSAIDPANRFRHGLALPPA